MSNKEKKATGAEVAEKASAQATDQETAKTAKTSKEKKQTGNNALKAVGLAACKRHNLTEVWVTADGQTFPKENDAKSHAQNLANNELIKVTAQ